VSELDDGIPEDTVENNFPIKFFHLDGAGVGAGDGDGVGALDSVGVGAGVVDTLGCLAIGTDNSTFSTGAEALESIFSLDCLSPSI
jgi:hypothetical protein